MTVPTYMTINEKFKSQGFKSLGVCKPKRPRKEMTNNRNINGLQGESLTENSIICSGISYEQQFTLTIPQNLKPYFHQKKELKCDFMLYKNGKQFIVESKYQAYPGTVKDKIAGFIRDYKRFNIPVCLVLNGDGFGENFIEVEKNILKLDGLEHLFTIVKGCNLIAHLESFNP